MHCYINNICWFSIVVMHRPCNADYTSSILVASSTYKVFLIMKYFYYKGEKFNLYRKCIDYKNGIISEISYEYECDNNMYYILSHNNNFLIFRSEYISFKKNNLKKFNRNISFYEVHVDFLEDKYKEYFAYNLSYTYGECDDYDRQKLYEKFERDKNIVFVSPNIDEVINKIKILKLFA